MIKFDNIQMVDLVNQHKKIQKELDKVILKLVMDRTILMER